MAKAMSVFSPRKHGFHFSNQFVNTVCETPFGNITTSGRCGGMAFAALDYFYANLPIPTHRSADFPDGKVPPDHSRLADYIYDRLIDSFVSNGFKFLSWTQKLDHSTWVYGEGVTKLTKNEEFPKLMQRLASGPVALGLIKAEHLWDVGSNHQVVAYGAELDEASGFMTVYLYDNNAPGVEVKLTSSGTDPHFTSSLTDAAGNHYWYRGWFVEEYTPRHPGYVDLAVVQGLSLSDPYPDLGDPLDCTYTVKNFGDFAAHVDAFNVEVAVPPGEGSAAKFAPDTGAQVIPAQQEHVFAKHCDCFAMTKGPYTLRIACTPGAGITSYPPTAFAAGPVTVFVPTGQLTLDVQRLSSRVLATPPWVEYLEAVSVSDGVNTPQKPCEQPRLKYRASWLYESAATRRLELFSEPFPTLPNKSLVFTVKFSTPGAMKPASVRLTVTGQAPDGSSVNATVPLTGSKDLFTGKWKPPQCNGNRNAKLNVRVEGADDVLRLATRTPPGNVLDSRPQTIATVDTAGAGYPFGNYEPGADANYLIELAARVAALPPDAKEANDSFAGASKVVLTGATATGGAWSRHASLNFHSATDQDVFSIQYESLPGDDTCQLAAPTETCVSSYLGIYLTNYPPCLCLSVNGGGMCTDIDLYKMTASAPQLYKSHPAQNSVSLYNPTAVFTGKTLYAMIKNSSFTQQGAFPFGIDIGYLPAHSTTRVDSNAPAYAARLEIQRKILKRYYEAIDLPRPGDDLLNRAADPSFPYESGTMIITSLQKFLVSQKAFLSHPETLAHLQAIAPKKAHAVVAGALRKLGQIAEGAKLNSDAEELYRASAATYAVGNLALGQKEVLQTLGALYKAQSLFDKAAQVKKEMTAIVVPKGATTVRALELEG